MYFGVYEKRFVLLRGIGFLFLGYRMVEIFIVKMSSNNTGAVGYDTPELYGNA